MMERLAVGSEAAKVVAGEPSGETGAMSEQSLGRQQVRSSGGGGAVPCDGDRDGVYD